VAEHVIHIETPFLLLYDFLIQGLPVKVFFSFVCLFMVFFFLSQEIKVTSFPEGKSIKLLMLLFHNNCI
jgi:hypothetical protein